MEQPGALVPATTAAAGLAAPDAPVAPPGATAVDYAAQTAAADAAMADEQAAALREMMGEAAAASGSRCDGKLAAHRRGRGVRKRVSPKAKALAKVVSEAGAGRKPKGKGTAKATGSAGALAEPGEEPGSAGIGQT